MTEQFPKRTGVFPWTRLAEEDAYMVPATDLKNHLDGISSKWIILSATFNVANVESFDFLQRTLTSFISYYSASHFRYDHALWFGSDNLPTTLHYINELAKLRNVKTTEGKDSKDMSPKDAKRIFGEILQNLDSTSSVQKKVLCIFSGPEYYENKSEISELWPFIPSVDKLEKYRKLDITFLVITSSPEHWSDSKFCHVSIPPINYDFENLFIAPWSRVNTTEDPSILEAMSLVSLLYPDNFSPAFVQGLLECRWPTEIKLSHYKRFIEWKLLREVKATNPKNTCMDRSFQRYLWTSLPEDVLVDSVVTLQNYVAQIQNQHQSSRSFPFVGLVIEAAVHQLWLKRFLANIDYPPTETPLANQVIEYLHLKKVGKIVLDKRKILGEGAYSKVFWGQIIDSPEITRDVAVKRVPLDFDYLYRETNNLAQLDPKDRLVRYILREDDLWNAYIALELCNQTLKDWVIQQGLVDLNRFEILNIRIKLLEEITEGTKYLHDQNLLHRDIKHSNILLVKKGTEMVAKLADFGLSKELKGGAASISGRAGTHGWMAPEMSYTGGKSTTMADIYSLGCVFYYVLTCGELPTSHRRIQRLSFDYFGVTETIAKMMSRDSDDRISADELLGYPIFWHRIPKKFIDFLIRLRMESGSTGTKVRRGLESIQLQGWKCEMAARYPDFEPLLKRMSRFGQYQDTAESFLRCARNAAVHAQDHKDLQLLFVNKYYATELDYYAFFQTWFQPFPELFYQVFLVNTSRAGTPISELDEDTEDDLQPVPPSAYSNTQRSIKQTADPNFSSSLETFFSNNYAPAPGSFLGGAALGSITTYLLMRFSKS